MMSASPTGPEIFSIVMLPLPAMLISAW